MFIDGIVGCGVRRRCGEVRNGDVIKELVFWCIGVLWSVVGRMM